MNSIQVTGRTTQEIVLKKTDSGKSYCKFCIAVDRPGQKDKSDFFTCLAWNRLSEIIVANIGKGSLIGISGILTINEWKNKKGENRREAEIIISELDFLNVKPVAMAEEEEEEPELEELEDNGLDLPFEM